MKKLLITMLSLAVLFAVNSCAKKPSGILDRLQDAAKSGKFEDVKKFYTKGTLAAMEDMNRLVPPRQKDGKYEDNKFAGGAKWDVVSEKVEGDAADIKIKYTEHPVENMKGLEISFRLKKEDGSWKIDMEREIRQSLEMIKGMGKEMDLMKSYKAVPKKKM